MILVVEDNFEINRNIKYILEENGYEVCSSHTCSECLAILHKQIPQLILLDIKLPDGNGFDLCSTIREKSIVPIIILTSCDDETDIVRGLSIGADDYVTKPFRTAELLSRIHAQLRRTEVNATRKYLISGKLILDEVAGKLYIEGEEKEVRPLEFTLLSYLIHNAGRLISREELFDKLWDSRESFVDDNTLTVTMSRLRKMIGPGYIGTIRGVGYRFEKTVVYDNCLR